MAIYGRGLDFQEKVRACLEQLSEGLKECSAFTPFVARYEIIRLKSRIKFYAGKMKTCWYLNLYADKDLLESYQKDLLENVQSSEKINLTPQTPTKPADKSPKQAQQEILREKSSVERSLTADLLEANTEGPKYSDEKSIMEFLNENPKINDLRKERMDKLFQELQGKEVTEEQILMNEEGKLATLIKFQGDDYYFMVRNDQNGQKVISRKVSTGWFHVDEDVIMEGKESVSFFTSKPFEMHLPQVTISSSLAMSSTGAVGDFLYKLVEGKEKVGDLSKDLMKDAGSSMAMTVLMSTMPWVAFSLASLVGVKALNELRVNQYIKSSKKAVIISDLIARTGAKAAMTVGGAAIGQGLIPIPFLGAFIGGVIGGFTASAMESTYDSLMTKRISMEHFCFFCILKIKKYGKWSQEKLDVADVTTNDELLSSFLEVIGRVSTVKFHKHKFQEELIKTKQKAMHDLIDEIYASIAEKDKSQEIGPDFEALWKSMIIYSFFSYYYFLLSSQLQVLQSTQKIREEEKLAAIDKFESLLDVDPLLEWISPQMSMIGQFKPYESFILEVNSFLKSCKLVTMFNAEASKAIKDDPEKIGQSNKRSHSSSKVKDPKKTSIKQCNEH